MANGERGVDFSKEGFCSGRIGADDDPVRFQTILNGSAFFKKFGITIRNLGYSEGMSYENPEIQKQIDAAFTAELAKKVAEQDRQAQTVKNLKQLEITQNELKILRIG